MLRKITYTLKLVTILSIVGLLQSCAIGQKPILKKWVYQESFDSSYSYGKTREEDAKLIESFIELYRLNSYMPKYNELRFHIVVLDKDKSFRFYLFDIAYVRDSEVVFKVDGENKLVDNFLISTF